MFEYVFWRLRIYTCECQVNKHMTLCVTSGYQVLKYDGDQRLKSVSSTQYPVFILATHYNKSK